MTFNRRMSYFGLIAAVGVLGCDGKDPERLKNVGNKLTEKGRKFTDETPLPKIEVTYPQFEKSSEKGKSGKEDAPPASIK